MFLNVVIGKPLVDPKTLLALDDLDWKNNEQPIYKGPYEEYCGI